jgi:FkbM family methyltransferase
VTTGDLTQYLAKPTEVELELIRLFKPSKALTFFDVGACEGEESVRYARRFPKARIFAFEPLPANQQLVRENFSRFAIGAAELVPIALSDRRGKAVFHVSSGRPSEEFAGPNWNYGNKSSSLLAPTTGEPMYGWIEFKETITVRTDTLNNFCRERDVSHIDFIHMDVQGAEHLVLAGASTILPRVTALWLEVFDQQLYQGQLLRPDTEHLMRAHGFALALETRRKIEGDQLYVNRRIPRTWRYLACKHLVSSVRSIKRRVRTGKS